MKGQLLVVFLNMWVWGIMMLFLFFLRIFVLFMMLIDCMGIVLLVVFNLLWCSSLFIVLQVCLLKVQFIMKMMGIFVGFLGSFYFRWLGVCLIFVRLNNCMEMLVLLVLLSLIILFCWVYFKILFFRWLFLFLLSIGNSLVFCLVESLFKVVFV